MEIFNDFVCVNFEEPLFTVIIMKGYKDPDNEGLNWAIGFNRFGLRLFGIWPGKSLDNGSNIAYLTVPMMLIVTTITLFLPQMYALLHVINELPLVVDNLLTSIAIIINSIKLFVFWQKRYVLTPVVTSLTDDWLKHRADWERQIMLKMAGLGRHFTMIGGAIMIGCFFGFVLFPLVGISYRALNNITDYENRRFLPVQSLYPFDHSISPYYELTYLSQVYPCYVVCISLTVLNSFFSVLVFHTCGQLEIIGVKLQNLFHNASTPIVDEKAVVEYIDVQSQLSELVRTHVHQIMIVEIIEDSYHLIILSECLAVSMFTCCLGFMISNILENSSADNMEPIIQILFLSGSLSCVLVHVFAFCLAGETLAFQSEDIVRHVCFSKWYTLCRRNVLDLFPILIRAGHPIRVTAGKFMFLSLETYGRILKTSAGYISMLIAVKNK